MIEEKHYQRLSDVIIKALELAIEQKDVVISDLLRRALDMTMRRNAASRSNIDRRDTAVEIEKVVEKLEALKREVKGG